MPNNPPLSNLYQNRRPSDIRLAQIEFAKRKDKVDPINVAIGNVSLPMHPAMFDRLKNITSPESPFHDGVLKYSETVGFKETNDAFLNIINASGFATDKLYSQITDGGSHAMELVIVGTCGDPGTTEKPLLLIDPAYTNYKSLANRTGRATVSISRTLNENGKYSLPDFDEIEKTIQKYDPGAIIVIPYDNPTGNFCEIDTLIKIAQLCVKYNLWMVSDEAYRELYYSDECVSSIWGITNNEVPGIEGHRISIETASKVWNACGSRIGAVITDSEEFHTKCLFEQTANLCAPALEQYIFGALAHIPKEELQQWYKKQRAYYKEIGKTLQEEFLKLVPGAIISSPDSSIYSVVDVRNIVDNDFNASDFVMFCTTIGKVAINGADYTLLVAPMAGFYSVPPGKENPGKYQMRIAYVESPERMRLIPEIFAKLLVDYKNFQEK